MYCIYHVGFCVDCRSILMLDLTTRQVRNKSACYKQRFMNEIPSPRSTHSGNSSGPEEDRRCNSVHSLAYDGAEFSAIVK